MLHITTQKSTNHHKKAITAEVFISVAMLAVFFIPASQASDITVDVIIELTNKARQVADITILKKNDLLQKAAEEKAQDMIEKNYFAHISPQGKSPWEWIEQVNYDYRYAGENLAINFTNAEDEQKAWMDSPLHKKNILNPKYDEIGVAVKQATINGRETILVVQMFGTQMEKDISSISETKPEIPVAGARISGVEKVSSLQKISDGIKPDMLLKNNSPTLIGWFSAFALAIIFILIDAVAVILGKHKSFFIPSHGMKK